MIAYQATSARRPKRIEIERIEKRLKPKTLYQPACSTRCSGMTQ